MPGGPRVPFICGFVRSYSDKTVPGAPRSVILRDYPGSRDRRQRGANDRIRCSHYCKPHASAFRGSSGMVSGAEGHNYTKARKNMHQTATGIPSRFPQPRLWSWSVLSFEPLPAWTGLVHRLHKNTSVLSLRPHPQRTWLACLLYPSPKNLVYESAPYKVSLGLALVSSHAPREVRATSRAVPYGTDDGPSA